ncbi:MAG: sugar kinase [Treponema sp.]|jgi:xylulokinase|nr:sugar kinase [Treponema sp.]
MERSILCVDIGTSSLKVASIRVDGYQLAFAREYYPIASQAVEWEKAFFRILKKLSLPTPYAVCISSNGPTLVPVDKSGLSLKPLYWYDNHLISTRTSSLFLPYVAHMLHNQPEAYKNVHFFISAQEWLAWRLGAEAVTVLPTSAYRTSYWDEEQCNYYGIDIKKFPHFVPMGAIIGLWSGIPIIAGVPDFVAALIGTGTIEPGIVCDRAGSSEGINLCISDPVHIPALRLLPSPIEGLWNLSGIIPESGILFDRYRFDTQQQDQSYEETLQNILNNKNEHAQQGKVILEKMMQNVRDILDIFKKHGFFIHEMRISGGQGKSHIWNTIRSKSIGCTLIIPDICDGELAGNAVIAATRLGIYSNIEEAVQAIVHYKFR